MGVPAREDCRGLWGLIKWWRKVDTLVFGVVLEHLYVLLSH